MSLCLHKFEKQTLDAICFQLGLRLIMHLCINHATKHANVGDVHHFPTLCSFGRLFCDGHSWTLVAHVHCITHCLHPKFMADALGMNYGLCHLHDDLISFFSITWFCYRVLGEEVCSAMPSLSKKSSKVGQNFGLMYVA